MLARLQKSGELTFNLFSSVAGIEIAANIDLTGFSGKPGGSPNG
jgi:hypothetical protein